MPRRLASLVFAALLLSGASSPVRAGGVERISSFEGGTGWLNSGPFTPEQLAGKVVLVDFWEYTCINCLRTLPYLREWYRRYHDHGFEIIGVHTPEFDFSGERANVATAARRLGVTWPIVLDGRDRIWKRYGNDGWPHEFLFDQSGALVESFFGEGGYLQTEARIQSLLRRTNPQLELPPVMALLPEDSYDKPGAVCYPKTPELLVGRLQIANAAGGDPAQAINYEDTSSNRQDGAIYLQGYWRLTREASVSGESHGYLALRYHAIQVMAVMKPESGTPIRVDVTQDGAPVARADAGNDLTFDSHGNSFVTVTQPRAYDVITNAHFGQHTLTLAPKSDGLGIYDLAFESCEVPGAR